MTTILKRVTTPAELLGIQALQSANLGRQLTSDERARQGFLTSEYTAEFLAELHRHAPAVIAVAGDAVVGYALVATAAARDAEASLAGLFESIDATTRGGVRLADRRYLVCAAVCVAKSHRGQGLFGALYGAFRAELGDRYDCVITDIARENARSLAAHRRVGFEVCHTLRYDGQQWNLVIWDWASSSR